MSLVGTRPILPDELEQYELHHRARIAIKKYFRLSPRYNSKAELGDKCKENYSAVLVGSDQLWLPGNIAADYYSNGI